MDRRHFDTFPVSGSWCEWEMMGAEMMGDVLPH